MSSVAPTFQSAREVLLVGIQGSNALQLAVIAICRECGATIVARDAQALVVQFGGTADEVDRFIVQLPCGAVTQTCRETLAPSMS